MWSVVIEVAVTLAVADVQPCFEIAPSVVVAVVVAVSAAATESSTDYDHDYN